MFAQIALAAAATADLLEYLDLFDGVEAAVRETTGVVGLAVVAVYSFLIAFALPLPSELVLATPLHLGLSRTAELGIVVAVSSAAKALGSVVAFRLGHGATHSGPVVRWLRRSGFDVVGYSERRTVELARKHGYAGLALALSVPGFPDTLSIYAFSVLEENYARFALATFVGSVGRLLVTLAAAGGVASVL